jgi:branched-chain amino acid transport system permease protein
VLTFISAYLAEFPEWRMIVYSLTMIILMLRRPQGLFGSQELSRSMFHLNKLGKFGGAHNDD